MLPIPYMRWQHQILGDPCARMTIYFKAALNIKAHHLWTCFPEKDWVENNKQKEIVKDLKRNWKEFKKGKHRQITDWIIIIEYNIIGWRQIDKQTDRQKESDRRYYRCCFNVFEQTRIALLFPYSLPSVYKNDHFMTHCVYVCRRSHILNICTAHALEWCLRLNEGIPTVRKKGKANVRRRVDVYRLFIVNMSASQIVLAPSKHLVYRAV